MEELNRVKLLNLDSRSKPPKKKKQNKTKHLNQNTQPPPDSTTKATIGEDDEGDITAKNKACKPQLSSSPYDFFFSLTQNQCEIVLHTETGIQIYLALALVLECCRG